MSKPSLKSLMPPPEDKPDPMTNWMIHGAILQALIEPAKAHLAKQVDKLVEKNQQFSNIIEPFFSYKGDIYTRSDTPFARGSTYPRVMPRLHQLLWTEAEVFLAEAKELREETPRLSSAISTILTCSRHLDDYRELFPSSLHHHIQWQLGHSSHQRISPAALLKAKQSTKASADLLRQRLAANLLY